MRKHIKYMAFAVAAALLLSGCAFIKNIGNAFYNIEQSMNSDGMRRWAADNVKLAVFGCGGKVYAHTSKPCREVQWYELGDAEGIELSDGQFGFVTADVTFYSGGYEGLDDKPVINNFINFCKADLPQINTFCNIPDFVNYGEHYNSLSIYPTEKGEYYIFHETEWRLIEENGENKRVLAQDCLVFLNGESVGIYNMNEMNISDIAVLLDENGDETDEKE